MKKRDLENREHIRELTKFLLPVYRAIDPVIGNRDTRREHPVETLMEMLWAEGECPPIGINTVCKRITERKGWEFENEKMPVIDELHDRLQKRVQRINRKLALTDCPFYSYIKYDRSTSKLQLILKPDNVLELFHRAEGRCRLRGMTKEIPIEIIARKYSRGVPVLRVGDVIKCRLEIPVTGYPHLFHVDANGAVDKMFPASGAKKETVRCGEHLEFPEDLLKEGFWWKVGKTTGKDRGIQQVVALISRLDVKVAAEHLKGFGVKIRTRGALQEEARLEDMNPGSVAFGSANYEMHAS